MKSSLLTYIIEESIRAVKAFFTSKPEISSSLEDFLTSPENSSTNNFHIKNENFEKNSELPPKKPDEKRDPDSSGSQTSISRVDANEKNNLFISKNDIRRAILFSAILHRPEERWEEEKK